MTTTQETLQDLMMDAAVETSITMTSEILGLPEETVTRILQVGLPMLARMAEENPELLADLYARSVELLPEPAQQFYANLAENPEARQQLIEQFKTMVGPMMESLNREVSRQAGTTETQAESTLATTYPAVGDALRRTAPEPSEQGFGQRLKNLIT